MEAIAITRKGNSCTVNGKVIKVHGRHIPEDQPLTTRERSALQSHLDNTVPLKIQSSILEVPCQQNQ